MTGAINLTKVQFTLFTLIFVHFYLVSFPLNPSVNPKEENLVRSDFYFPDKRYFISILKES